MSVTRVTAAVTEVTVSMKHVTAFVTEVTVSMKHVTAFVTEVTVSTAHVTAFCDRGECVNDRCDGGEHHRGRKVTVSCRRVVRKTTETACVTERHDGVGNSGLTK